MLILVHAFVVDDLMPHFGAYTPLVRVAAVEIRQSIYVDGHVPYFALAKYQARLLDTLHRDRSVYRTDRF